MSCAARYSETTSLEFILNPFKFFFTNYVAKIAPHSPPNIHHLESLFRRPTILRVERSNSSLTKPLQHLHSRDGCTRTPRTLKPAPCKIRATSPLFLLSHFPS
ncbi:hypothetical protein BWU74_29975 [Paraburkholderia caledonica]|nr:hypothetical protein BWU74_29975 [Burkholderia sp. Bk]